MKHSSDAGRVEITAYSSFQGVLLDVFAQPWVRTLRIFGDELFVELKLAIQNWRCYRG